MGKSNSNVMSFLDQIKKNDALREAEFEIENDPEVKYRKLEDTKKCGKDECLKYIFRDLCNNSVPDIKDINPDHADYNVPDLDTVIDRVVKSRTGGEDLTFYVKEGLKRTSSSCLKNIIESVDKIVENMYIEQSIHPETITKKDLTFKLTPDIEDKLQEIISDNHLDSLADVIKDNVKADAVDEVISVKKEKDDRMKLEDELTNDVSIASEAAIRNEITNRGLMNRKFYQPSLFEAVLINSFNSLDPDESEMGGIDDTSMDVSDSLFDQFRTNPFNLREDYITRLDMSKLEGQLNGYLATSIKKTANNYLSQINCLNLEKLSSELSNDVRSSKIAPEQTVELVNLNWYLSDLIEFGKKITSAMRNNKIVPRFPEKQIDPVSVEYLPKELDSTIEYLEKTRIKFMGGNTSDYISKFSGITICRSLGIVDMYDIDNVFHLCLLAGLINLEFAQSCIDNILQIVSYAKSIKGIADSSPEKDMAFTNALYEYTVLNVSKALRLEPFSLQDIREMANDYATRK